jgi:hypothetical protein
MVNLNQNETRQHWFEPAAAILLKGLSNAASAVVEPLKINATIETSRKGRCVFVKRRHPHGITAIFTLLEIVLVGVAIASLLAIAIASQVASSLPVSRFNASANPHASGVI